MGEDDADDLAVMEQLAEQDNEGNTVLTASRSRRLLFFATAAAVPADDAAGSGGWRR